METKVLVVGIVRKGQSVLMRKKPDGSPPYAETWYVFGAELRPGIDPNEAIRAQVRAQSGIEISVSDKFSWDTEVKNDLDGIEKQFVYLDVLCDYVSGELVAAAGIEKLEFVAIDKLAEYDIVPPSVTVFTKLGWLPG